MSTSFEKIIAKFFRKIEKDRDFFAYYNVDFSEAMSLAREQANGYLLEAVEKLTDECVPDVDFFEGCFDRMRAGGTEPARDRMLVVGDSPTSDMQGARNAGIDCCQYLGISQMEDGQATYRIQNLWELEDIICQNHPIRS